MIIHIRFPQGTGNETILGVSDSLLTLLVHHLINPCLFPVADSKNLLSVGQFLHNLFQVFIVLQQFDDNILGPKILGDATGISSFWVIVAILVGGGFGGVLGMFLGVPVFACVQELVKFLMDRRLQRRDMPTEAYAYVDRAREKAPEETEKESRA